jgi:hypothetical protein
VKRLRLLEVVVQPVFVIDDGETLSKVTAQPGAVSAADWPSYPATRFADQVAEFEKQLSDGGGGPGGPADLPP